MSVHQLGRCRPSVQGTLALDLGPDRAMPRPRVPRGLRRTALESPLADVVPIASGERERLEVWAGRFAQSCVEIVGGDRPASQLLRFTTGTVYADLHRRALLVARAGGHQPGIGRVQTVRPQVVTVHTSLVEAGVAETSVRVRYGERSRAVAIRFQRRADRWVCTALEFA